MLRCAGHIPCSAEVRHGQCDEWDHGSAFSSCMSAALPAVASSRSRLSTALLDLDRGSHCRLESRSTQNGPGTVALPPVVLP